jgi:hypothetical protein
MDHGSQYLTDHFINQVRFWGITPSFAFVEQPQTNGVVERFNRILKEQSIYGKVLRNVEEVRRAVGKFVEDYNSQWRVEKNGFSAHGRPGRHGARPFPNRPRDQQTCVRRTGRGTHPRDVFQLYTPSTENASAGDRK